MKNLLHKTYTYLAGPMQFTQHGQTWREMVKKELSPLGIRIFDPYNKPFLNELYLEGNEDKGQMDKWEKEGRIDLIENKMRAVRSSDLALCDKADFGIFYLNPSIATVGTIEELTTMNRAKRPCFVLWDNDKPSYWLLGMLKSKYIYRTWEKLLGTIKAIDSGEIEPDSRRWKLLSPEYR